MLLFKIYILFTACYNPVMQQETDISSMEKKNTIHWCVHFTLVIFGNYFVCSKFKNYRVYIIIISGIFAKPAGVAYFDYSRM